MSESNGQRILSPWRAILKLAAPYRARFLVVLIVAAISTAASLIEPLIYRAAVNDVAGLFVERAREDAPQEPPA
jgi:ATP-binding cassette, subfamily B, bacterial